MTRGNNTIIVINKFFDKSFLGRNLVREEKIDDKRWSFEREDRCQFLLRDLSLSLSHSTVKLCGGSLCVLSTGKVSQRKKGKRESEPRAETRMEWEKKRKVERERENVGKEKEHADKFLRLQWGVEALVCCGICSRVLWGPLSTHKPYDTSNVNNKQCMLHIRVLENWKGYSPISFLYCVCTGENRVLGRELSSQAFNTNSLFLFTKSIGLKLSFTCTKLFFFLTFVFFLFPTKK